MTAVGGAPRGASTMTAVGGMSQGGGAPGSPLPQFLELRILQLPLLAAEEAVATRHRATLALAAAAEARRPRDTSASVSRITVEYGGQFAITGGGGGGGAKSGGGGGGGGIPGQSAYFGVSGGNAGGATSAYFAPK